MKAQTEKTDRRTNRTKKLLRDSLVQIILEKHYDSITVQDIIDRADVGRSTFYLHFRDKEDLLIGDWKRFLDFFVQHLDWSNLKEGRFIPIGALFHHLKDFHHFYRALVKSQKIESLFKQGCRFLSENIENELASRFDKSDLRVPPAILANYLAVAIFNHLRWWLDNHMPNSPEEMDEIFHNLVMPGIRNSFINHK